MIKPYNSKVDTILLLNIALLLVVGVFSVFSTSFYSSIARDMGVSGLVITEIKYVVIGIIALAIMYVVGHKIFDSPVAYLFFAFAYFLLIIVLLIGHEAKGGQRWIQMGSFRFMPSEVMRLASIILFAKILSGKKTLDSFWKDIVPLLIIILLVIAPIMLQPNMSTASIFALVMLIMMFFAGMKKRHIAILAAPVMFAFAFFVIKEPYRLARYTSFLDPYSDPLGSGYQVINSLSAFSRGGINGVGLGNGVLNKLFIPEPHNDFIFATIGEELGFIGCLIIIALFVWLVFTGFKIALSCEDKFSFYLAAGISTSISVQFIINICVTLSIVPVTGLVLPFISYGGTNLIMLLATMGVLLSISRQNKLRK